MAYVVFVSHSHSDRWIARQIARCLEEVGVDAWLDEKSVDAGRVSAKIKDGIRESQELCVLVSSASLQSDWVKHEVGAADILNRPIGLLMDKVTGRRRPETWVQFEPIDLNEFERYLDMVGRRARLATP